MVLSLEGALANRGGAVAAERVLRLASGELDRAYRLAGLILADQHEAQDATQDALLRAWRSAASLRDPAGFQAWFDRILVNVCRDSTPPSWRPRARRPRSDPGSAPPSSRPGSLGSHTIGSWCGFRPGQFPVLSRLPCFLGMTTSAGAPCSDGAVE